MDIQMPIMTGDIKISLNEIQRDSFLESSIFSLFDLL